MILYQFQATMFYRQLCPGKDPVPINLMKEAKDHKKYTSSREFHFDDCFSCKQQETFMKPFKKYQLFPKIRRLWTLANSSERKYPFIARHIM